VFNLVFKQSAILCSAVLGTVLFNATGIQPSAFATPEPTSPDAPYVVSQRSILDSMMSAFRGRQPRREGIRRSGELCPMSPGLVGTDQVWHDRPLFMWQGTANRVVLKDFESGAELWSQPLDSTAQQITYSGSALVPGMYQWELSNPTGSSSSFIFEIIGGEQRQQITDSLRQLESQIGNKTAEEKALATADYFMQQELWSDAFQALYSISNPSTEVKQAAQEISAYVCPSRVVQ
jgi:hypothetical protein